MLAGTSVMERHFSVDMQCSEISIGRKRRFRNFTRHARLVLGLRTWVKDWRGVAEDEVPGLRR